VSLTFRVFEFSWQNQVLQGNQTFYYSLLGYSLYYIEECNELAGPTARFRVITLRQHKTVCNI